jgi:hypothetical protein
MGIAYSVGSADMWKIHDAGLFYQKLKPKEKREKKKASLSAASERSQNARGHKIGWVKHV